MDWFYIKDGQQIGPVPFETIATLAKDGMLIGTDYVWTASFDQQWKNIADIPELLAAIQVPQNAELMRRARHSLHGNWGKCAAIMAVMAGIFILTALPPHFIPDRILSPKLTNILLMSIDLAIGALVMYGYAKTFLRVAREGKLHGADMLSGFPQFFKALWAQIWIMMYTIALMIVLAVPVALVASLAFKRFFLDRSPPAYAVAVALGIMMLPMALYAVLRYSMAFFIMADNPDLSPIKAVHRSTILMRGYKWKLCCLYGRFLGWGVPLALAGYGIFRGLCAIVDVEAATQQTVLVLCLHISLLALTPYIQTATAHFYRTLPNLKSKI
ncbi:MAG: DUF975 family protein [Kiritimatiellaeota bacterium]|nr:DUF975 family protein [Kiritimatiellota bacterium]